MYTHTKQDLLSFKGFVPHFLTLNEMWHDVSWYEFKFILTKKLLNKIKEMQRMETLADTTDLLEKTTSELMAEDHSLNAQSGIKLIDQWMAVLSENENTKPIALELDNLKALLGDAEPDSTAIIAKMVLLAGKVLIIAPDIGAEGEVPSLLNALASALKLATDHHRK